MVLKSSVLISAALAVSTQVAMVHSAQAGPLLFSENVLGQGTYHLECGDAGPTECYNNAADKAYLNAYDDYHAKELNFTYRCYMRYGYVVRGEQFFAKSAVCDGNPLVCDGTGSTNRDHFC